MKPKSIKSIRSTQVLLSFALAAIAAPALDFSAVAAVTIPEGAVESISTLGGEVLWKRLPYDAEVEYLESVFGQTYVFETLRFTRFVARFTPVSAPANTRFVMAGGNNGVYRNGSGYLASSMNADARSTGKSWNKALIADYDVVAKKTVFYNVDCTVYAQIAHANPPAYLAVIQIFGTEPHTTYSSNMRLCWLRCYDGATLVRDYNPVRVGTVGYLYDRVSGRLFGNQGTGAFVVGPDK